MVIYLAIVYVNTEIQIKWQLMESMEYAKNSREKSEFFKLLCVVD